MIENFTNIKEYYSFTNSIDFNNDVISCTESIKTIDDRYNIEDNKTSCTCSHKSDSLISPNENFNSLLLLDVIPQISSDILVEDNKSSFRYDNNPWKNIHHEIFDLTTLKSIPKFINNRIKAGFETESFIVTNLNTIVNQFHLWKKELPMIRPFYAVKCNPDTAILRVS